MKRAVKSIIKKVLIIGLIDDALTPNLAPNKLPNVETKKTKPHETTELTTPWCCKFCRFMGFSFFGFYIWQFIGSEVWR